MDETLYREEQWFPKFVGAIVGGAAAGSIIGLAIRRPARWVGSMAATAAGLAGATLLFAPMRTTVDRQGVNIAFGLGGWIRFRIPASEIGSVEPVTYNPLREFGGWGIRFGRGGTRAYTVSGNRGVRIGTDRHVILVGSGDPEALAAAIRHIIPAAAATPEQEAKGNG